MLRAIATIIIGQKHSEAWKNIARPSWERYCETHGFELVVFDQLLDTSTRAMNRSPAWQKLLVPTSPRCNGFDRLVWVDSDIIIRAGSPDVCAKLPEERIGMCDEFSCVSKELYLEALNAWHPDGLAPFYSTTPDEYHRAWGLPAGAVQALQSGVIVLSPKCHGEFFKHVYNKYEDRGSPEWHYEMRPLSYEVQAAGLSSPLDWRFNALWSVWKNVLKDLIQWTPERRAIGLLNRLLRLAGKDLKVRDAQSGVDESRAVVSALRQSYFLHFAGDATQMLRFHNELRQAD